MSWIPGISQIKSLFQFATGDSDGAKKTQEEFLDTWKNHKLELLSDVVDNIPVVGHIKGDNEGAIRAEESASRTLFVIGAVALVAGTGGTAAPVVAGVAAGVLADGITTGIETARHDGKYDPQGMVAVGTNVVRDIQRGKHPVGDIFDGVVIAACDGLIGASKAKGKAGEPRTRIFRVEGRSLERLKESANATIEDFQAGDNQRIFYEDDHVQARPNMGPRGPPESLIRDFSVDEVDQLEEFQAPEEPHPATPPEYKDYLLDVGGICDAVSQEAEIEEVRERPADIRQARQPKANMLYLNFGQEDRAYAYFAQKVINHRQIVKEYRNLGANGSHLITKKTHSIQIKSFEVYTRDLTEIERDAITEGQKNAIRRAMRETTPAQQELRPDEAALEQVGEQPLPAEREAPLPEYTGVQRADTTKAPRQYGLESHRYTPIFDKVIPGSFRSQSPWIKYLPMSVLERIRDHPVAVGKVRRFQYKRFAVTQAGGALKPVPIAQLKNITTEQITYQDVKPIVVAHCRHVKTITGATKNTPPEWEEHYEYLVKFNDGSPAEWYPGDLLAPDLRAEFYARAKASARPVGLLQGHQEGRHRVQRPDGSTDTIDDYQIFWDEEESDADQLSDTELHRIMDHLHKEHDLRGIRVLQQTSAPFPRPSLTGVAPCVDRDGTPVYFATAIDFKGGSHPCKVIGNALPSVRAGYNWEEYGHSGTYEILPFLPELMELVTSSKGQVPPGRLAVRGGAEADGRLLYHAVGNIGNLQVPGKAAPHLEGGFLPYNEKEIHVDECKIL
ncbi:hypothetical protein FQN54_004698 [Arachnomyces sp. PD_36]|nr:hypothetical protein FQN54_004698 [Arachnomyces sp. PD_36]